MNKKIFFIYLLILPVLLFVTVHILKLVQGPYYLNFYDPSYVYLISSLNLSQLSGFGIAHFDHPGTTVQVAGALLVRVYHFLSESNLNIANDVLTNPEMYLYFINTVYLIISCVCLFILGIFTFKLSNNIILSLLIQLSPFTSTEIFYGLIIDTPDNFLVFVSLIFVGFLIYYLFKIDAKTKTPFRFIIIAGLICGFGLVTKLNFLPSVLIPLIIIKEFKGKLYFLFFTFLSFLIFFSPVLTNYGLFLEWIEKLFINSGRYGTGEATIINETYFFGNIIKIFQVDKFYFFAYLMSFVSLLMMLFKKSLTKKDYEFKYPGKEIILLSAIFISMNFQILLVAKHYSQYYLIPSFMLSVFALILSANILKSYFYKINFKINYVYIIFIVFISTLSLYKIIYSYYEGMEQRKEAQMVVDLVEKNYSNEIVISGFGSANKNCALAFAVQYASDQKEKYNTILREMGRAGIFYNPWTNKLYYNLDKFEFENKIIKSKKIIFQINSYGNVDNFTELLKTEFNKEIISIKKIITNRNAESVYEIITN